MNLYLYIPPGSAHPTGILKSLIYGRLRSYWNQNTYQRDFHKMRQHLWSKLIDRGYTTQQLQPLFQTAMNKIHSQEQTIATPNADDDKPLFFHLEYHPRGVQRPQIRTAYQNILSPLFPDRRLIVAQHRPRNNIRDRICSTKLDDVPNSNPSDMYNQLQQQHEDAQSS